MIEIYTCHLESFPIKYLKINCERNHTKVMFVQHPNINIVCESRTGLCDFVGSLKILRLHLFGFLHHAEFLCIGYMEMDGQKVRRKGPVGQAPIL